MASKAALSPMAPAGFSASNSAIQCQALAFLHDSFSPAALMLPKPVMNSHATRIDYQHLCGKDPVDHSFWGMTLSKYSLEDFTSTRLFFFPSIIAGFSAPPPITSIVLVQRKFLFRYGLWLITASSSRRKTRKHRFSAQDIIGTALSKSFLASELS